MKLGHIIYSNCFPVHALLVNGGAPDNVELIRGTPDQLNRLLEQGEIDVAPSSSIEYARHADSYRLLPDFVIGSDGAVGSILFECKRDLASLRVDEHPRLAVPRESATSVVLLKILLKLKYGIDAQYEWFSQKSKTAPDADGALWIGDVALQRTFPRERHVYDLGAEWRDWTGLPFVFAAWQTGSSSERDGELQNLRPQLRASYQYFQDNASRLAMDYASEFGIAAPRLLAYWQSLRYTFDESMRKGLLKYYELAALLGETPAVGELKWVT